MLRRGMAGLVLVIISASAASAVEVGRLRGHLEFLASEALEGRLTGTPEEQRATAYVAQQFENIGLKPAGENGTYFQGFDFIASTLLAWIMHARSFCATGTPCYQRVSHQVKVPIRTLLIHIC
jgi:hypothetical protein